MLREFTSTWHLNPVDPRQAHHAHSIGGEECPHIETTYQDRRNRNGVVPSQHIHRFEQHLYRNTSNATHVCWHPGTPLFIQSGELGLRGEKESDGPNTPRKICQAPSRAPIDTTDMNSRDSGPRTTIRIIGRADTTGVLSEHIHEMHHL